MAEIRVNSQMLRDSATQIMSELGNFEQITGEVTNGLTSLSNTWTGEAFTSFYDNVRALEPTFEKYKEVIRQYADFLNNIAAEQYEGVESNINNATNDIVNDLFK